MSDDPLNQAVLTSDVAPEGPQSQNGAEIAGAYLRFVNITFTRGSIGIRFAADSTHMQLIGCKVHDTNGAAITLNQGDTSHFLFEGNEIYRTGLCTAQTCTSGVTGEAFYVGCNNAGCVAHSHIFRGNYIHDLRALGPSGGGNDGIELKYGSYNNTIEDNVIVRTNLGLAYPGILVYGFADDKLPRNIVRRNYVKEAGEGIQVVADVLVESNIVVGSTVQPLTAQTHAQVPSGPRNVHIVNNVFGSSAAAARIRWSSCSTCVLANNVFVDGDNFELGSGTTVANYLGPGGSTVRDGVALVGVANTASLFDGDMWPATLLRGAGVAVEGAAASLDFNGVAFAATSPDVGAYQTTQATSTSGNPGWTLADAFKDLTPVQDPTSSTSTTGSGTPTSTTSADGGSSTSAAGSTTTPSSTSSGNGDASEGDSDAAATSTSLSSLLLLLSIFFL
jgi:hypothetical protein